jgi:hypothetical protein
LDAPIADALQQALAAWEAGETAKAQRYLADATARAQANHTF